jgi:hypothetical protein
MGMAHATSAIRRSVRPYRCAAAARLDVTPLRVTSVFASHGDLHEGTARYARRVRGMT